MQAGRVPSRGRSCSKPVTEEIPVRSSVVLRNCLPEYLSGGD
jgi:hypothetical protein